MKYEKYEPTSRFALQLTSPVSCHFSSYYISPQNLSLKTENPLNNIWIYCVYKYASGSQTLGNALKNEFLDMFQVAVYEPFTSGSNHCLSFYQSEGSGCGPLYPPLY